MKQSKFLGKFKIYRWLTKVLFGWKWTKNPSQQAGGSMKNEISKIWTPKW
ncbi:hypothetical protein JXJ21_03145 [candidate division KSB1 bacterium]|nr:hypothetical protein [candidate division KSB1 bacterium]